ncbi:MAG: amino acid adenylation domain-containing protein [Acidobacteriota bacterium]
MGFLLHHSVFEAAQRDPDRDAFRFEGRGLTYAELAERSTRLANLLIAHGVKPHDRVGIYMNKSLELPVALYGVLAAGAAYVPIDPTAPAARVKFILEDCGIRHLITQGSHARKAVRLAADAPGLRCVVGAQPPATEKASDTPAFLPWSEVDAAPPQDPGVALVEHDLAYIMYTSGSTGAPKGLMHTHGSGLAYARLSAREYGVRPEDRLGNHSPLHFDMSTFEYLTGPWVGATTVIIPEEATMFPLSLAELIESERLTFWYSVPLALIQLLEQGEIEGRDLSSLRWVLFGGEPFAPKHLARLAELWPHARFSNSYGPAEVNQCTAYHLPSGPLDVEQPIPIGPVWPGAEGLIVSADDQEVAPGEVGELLIRAPTMMRGYWARPDLNQRAFYRQDLFEDFDKVFYRTGDLVRDPGDGNLLFLGRKDRLVKVRGYRVELDEVEAVLNALPDVAEAGAVAVRGDDGQATLCAAVLPREGATLDAAELRRGAAKRLSPYAVPSRIEVRTSLPRTGSGKIDRKALKQEFS